MTPAAPLLWVVTVAGVRHAIAAHDPAVPYRVAVDPVTTCCKARLRFAGQAELGEPDCPDARRFVFPEGLRSVHFGDKFNEFELYVLTYAGALMHGLVVEKDEVLARRLVEAGQNIGSEHKMRFVLDKIAGTTPEAIRSVVTAVLPGNQSLNQPPTT